jgi:hypothetical protein
MAFRSGLYLGRYLDGIAARSGCGLAGMFTLHYLRCFVVIKLYFSRSCSQESQSW